MHAAKPLVPDLGPFEIQIVIARTESYKSPGSDQIPAELIQAGSEKLFIYLIVGFRILLRVYPLMLFLKPPYATMFLCSILLCTTLSSFKKSISEKLLSQIHKLINSIRNKEELRDH
jgi:hypothetical protein